MHNDYCDFADQLAIRLTALNQEMEALILGQVLAGGDVYASPYIEFDLVTITDLCKILSADAALWIDFQRAVDAHRPSTHSTVFLEHVYAVGRLQGKRTLLEPGLTCPAPEDRRRLAGQLNILDGEIALCRHLADRRDLAKRVNALAGFPLVDGLSMRGLTLVLGKQEELRRAFRSLVLGRVASPM